MRICQDIHASTYILFDESRAKMILKLLFFTSKINLLYSIAHDMRSLPNYGIMEESGEIYNRRNMQQNLEQNLEEAENDTECYLDGILHFKATKGHPLWQKVKDIEQEIGDILTMTGVTYSYMRDTYWRTWREVKSKYGETSVVHYRLDTTENMVCPNCRRSGFWTIEDKPPCPYEIVSVINDDSVCAINYNQLNEDLGPCPSVITYRDITKTCDNPIVTKWRVDKILRDQEVSEQRNKICEKIFCEILTVYLIQPEYVVFRIINANNTIIYSRIMKNDNITYVCVENCGRYNKKTMSVEAETDNPLTIDLLESLPPKKKYKKNKSLMAHFYKAPMLKIPALVRKEKIFKTKLLPLHARFHIN